MATPASPRKTCPHCGGTNGLTYTAKLTTKRWASWDGVQDEEIDMSHITTPLRGTCQDCGKQAAIKPPIAQTPS